MEKKKTGSWKKWLLISLCAVLVMGTVSVAAVAGYANHLLNLMDRSDAGDVALSTEPTVAEQVTAVDAVAEDGSATVIQLADEPAEDLLTDGTINILLTGQDRREYQREQDKRGRSDTMVLLNFDVENKKLTVVSFIRNTYVAIPGYLPNTLNKAFKYGNYQLTEETLNYNYGVQIDGNLSIDFFDFIEAVDYMGGLDIELNEEQVEEMNREGVLDLFDHEPWELEAGMNHLDGRQVLAYTRLHTTDTDIERIDRHKIVIDGLMKKFMAMNLTEMNDALTALLPLIATDMTNEEIIDYALEILPLLSECEVVTQQIPAEGTYEYVTVEGSDDLYTVERWKVVNPDLSENQKILKELLPTD